MQYQTLYCIFGVANGGNSTRAIETVQNRKLISGDGFEVERGLRVDPNVSTDRTRTNLPGSVEFLKHVREIAVSVSEIDLRLWVVRISDRRCVVARDRSVSARAN